MGDHMPEKCPMDVCLAALSAAMRDSKTSRGRRITMIVTASCWLQEKYKDTDWPEHIVFCLRACEKLKGEYHPLSDLVAVRLAFLYGWSRPTGKESAVWAHDEITNWTGGERSELADEVRRMIWVIHGLNKPTTTDEHFAAQVGLLGDDLQMVKKGRARHRKN